MTDDHGVRFTVRLSAAPGQRVEAGELEASALRLRQELLDLGADRVEPAPVGPAPPGARGVDEITAIVQLVATVLGAAATVAQLVELVERWRQRQPRGEALRVEVERRARGPATRRTGRSALVVANAVYDDRSLQSLRSPARDADELARVLGDPAIGGFDVDLLTDADERTVRRRVAEFFSGRDRDDVLLLHFSCHGVKDARGRLHLAARDTELARLAATGVPAALVNDLMEESASARIVLILDCCYSGAFARGALARADRGVHLADAFGGTGRMVLTASSATEYSFEGDALSDSDATPSVFTGALVEGLDTGAADLDADGEISVDELFDYARQRVGARTPAQAPMKWSFGVSGSLVVARSPHTASLPAQVRADLASDRVVLRLEAVAALRALLTGPKAGVRDAADAELRHLHEQDDSGRVRDAAAAALDLPPAPALRVPAQAASPLAETTSASVTVAPLPTPSDTPPAAADPPAGRGSGVTHPGLLAAVVLATAVSLLQLGQMAHDLDVRLATSLSGVAFFAVMPVVAVAGLVTSLRRRARAWSIGTAVVLAVWVVLFATADLGVNAAPTALAGFYTEGPDQPGVAVFVVDLVVRLLVTSAAVAWYTVRGPRWNGLTLPGWGNRPALLVGAAVAGVVSLAGAVALSAGATPANHALFNLFGSARGDFTSGAVVGVANVFRSSDDGIDVSGAIWNAGWLALVAMTVAAAVSALRRRHAHWAAGLAGPLVVTLVLGFAAGGWHEGEAGVRGLALYLAAMTLTATAAVVTYAWRGPR